jgi:hypothetical protein
MKKFTIIIGAVALSASLATTVVFADNDKAPSNALPLAKIVSNLQDQGYNIIKEVEFDDGIYEAKVITAQGQKVKLEINPLSGEIENMPKNTTMAISINDALSKVEKAGYTDIYEIESEHGGYEVKAYETKNNKKVELYVDGQSGIITTDD